jgi:hypothetical protein
MDSGSCTREVDFGGRGRIMKISESRCLLLLRAAVSGAGHAVLPHAQRAYERRLRSIRPTWRNTGMRQWASRTTSTAHHFRLLRGRRSYRSEGQRRQGFPERAGDPVAPDAHRHDVRERRLFHTRCSSTAEVPHRASPVMKETSVTEISYSFEELPDGGRVRIKTANKDALNAVHDFLTFQIEDHHTGDKTE